jgi:hypothetical protein
MLFIEIQRFYCHLRRGTVFLDFGSSLPSASDGKVPSKCSNYLSRKESEYVAMITGLQLSATGWGRAHRRAINKWYESFSYPNRNNKNPEKLAYLVTKYKRRYGFSHRDIIRLAHTRTRNKSIKLKQMGWNTTDITKYIVSCLLCSWTVRTCTYSQGI